MGKVGEEAGRIVELCAGYNISGRYVCGVGRVMGDEYLTINKSSRVVSADCKIPRR